MMPTRFFYVVLLLLATLSSHAQENNDLSIRQKILIPGPVIQGHADIENECEKCHASFDSDSFTEQCLDCHEEIAADRDQRKGFHGLQAFSLNSTCETCHTDHEGRDYDITNLQADIFDHQYTNFPLTGSHEFQECKQCHEPNEKHRDADPACFSCHEDDDNHFGRLGEQCEDCHKTLLWKDTKAYDHSETDFPLEGKHETVRCQSCHIAEQYTFEEHTCVSCHKAADIHEGSNGNECNDCHTPEGWTEVDFDHDDTDFPLRGSHEKIVCQACHAPGEDPANTPQECNACHANDDIHFGRNGKDCESCHDSNSWKKHDFDHDRDTNYRLTGLHLEVECTQCHQGNVRDPQPRDCIGCHAADDIHNTDSMQICATCHSTDGWSKITLFDHDLTEFPLAGMHLLVPCESCHMGSQFAETSVACASCHSNDDVHKNSLGDTCNRCHTPNSWSIWEFDHNSETDFALEGNHKGVACDACHQPNTQPEQTSMVCGNCHKSHDIHKGEFGQNCGRCHTVENFFELKPNFGK